MRRTRANNFLDSCDESGSTKIGSAPLASLHQLSLETAQCPDPRSLQSEAQPEPGVQPEQSLVPISDEMIEEVTEEEAEPVLSKDFVSNTSAHGKVHCVIAHSEDLHPRHMADKVWMVLRSRNDLVCDAYSPTTRPRM